MGKFNEMKPQSKSEWLVVLVLAVMLVGTTVLLITKPFDRPEIEDVRLEAIAQSNINNAQSIKPEETSLSESDKTIVHSEDGKVSNPQSEKNTDEAMLKQKEKDSKLADNTLVFKKSLTQINDLQKDMRNNHLLPLLRDFRKDVQESKPEDYVEPLLGGGNLGIAENPNTVPLTQNPQELPQEMPQETPAQAIPSEAPQPVYNGPTSPPPLPKDVDPNAPARPTSPPPLTSVSETRRSGETSPPPLTSNSTQAPRSGQQSPPPLPQNPGTNNPPLVSSPPPLPQNPAINNNTPVVSSPPPPNSDPNASTGGKYAPHRDPAQTPTVMPSAERIATVEGGIVQKINQARAAKGLSALSTNGTLSSISKQRAGELSVYYHAAPNVHFRPDGSSALTYIQNTWGAKYGGGECTAWIDNVQGKLSDDYIFNAFYNSPSHHALIMYPQFKSVAVGIYCVPGPVPDNNTGSPNDSNLGRIFIAINFGF